MSEPLNISITLNHPDAKTPTRSRAEDAGYDLYALPCKETQKTNAFATSDSWPVNCHRPLYPGERRDFDTGISIAIPAGYFGRICDRSGNALKKGLHVLGGIVDSGYTGPVKVILLNTSQDPIWIESGQRIAQLIIERCYSVKWNLVDSLETTERAGNGFGSSGS